MTSSGVALFGGELIVDSLEQICRQDFFTVRLIETIIIPMKRTLFILVFAVVSIIANAQIRFNEFTPVVPNSSNGSSGSYIPSTPSYNSSRSKSRIRYNEFHPVVPNEETTIIGTAHYAKVSYESSTGHQNTYELPVVVSDGVVKQIIFNNGGSVHAGRNNLGYTYYGGKLQYAEGIDAYTTVVIIVYPNNLWKKYTIILDPLY